MDGSSTRSHLDKQIVDGGGGGGAAKQQAIVEVVGVIVSEGA